MQMYFGVFYLMRFIMSRESIETNAATLHVRARAVLNRD